ncbi:hypothetical protein CAAN1_06S02366 [[Candida] anglica]|uniref:Fe2OG dioxygenase domain-containing protein n=1 Tax=[Candida] anglica TaxID=148631 RepID=A0ABP0ELU7_9ASCO
MSTANPLQIVDISEVNKATADELLNAATTQGFLFVEGHDFTQEEVDLLFLLSKQFFELPLEYKKKYPINKNNHGYSHMGEEVLDTSDKSKGGDPKEALNFCCLNFETGLPSEVIPDWFLEDPVRLEKMKIASKKLYELSVKILRILAIGLQIEDTEECKGEDWFASRYHPTKQSGTTFRFLHYPGQKTLNPEAVIRAGAHTDYGSMTLLFQQENQEGLEIYSPVSKGWEPVPFVGANTDKFKGSAPPIVVNIADQLSYWTGGLLKSTIHRVKFPPKVQETGQPRYSIVFFSHPNDETLLEPVPSPIVRNIKGRGANNDEGKLVTAKQHLDKRLAATYGWSY